jgi:hypothetical protein
MAPYARGPVAVLIQDTGFAREHGTWKAISSLEDIGSCFRGDAACIYFCTALIIIAVRSAVSNFRNCLDRGLAHGLDRPMSRTDGC